MAGIVNAGFATPSDGVDFFFVFSGMQIGPYQLAGNLVLAPMAGVTDAAFRVICLRHGAAYAVGEMAASGSHLLHTEMTRRRYTCDPRERLAVVQILGADPAEMANAAALAQECGAAMVDVNFGCPARVVCGKACGSAVMRDPKLAGDILRAVASAVTIPVSVKMRTGWDEDMKTSVEIAKMAQDAGFCLVTVHGRTRAQRFTGTVNRIDIAEVVRAVQIPVIANGDVTTPGEALEMMRQTQAAGVMIGRGACGNPWLFSRAQALIDGKPDPGAPTARNVHETLEAHLAALFDGENLEELGRERALVRTFRKHLRHYLEGFCLHEEALSAKLGRMLRMETREALSGAVTEFFEEVPETAHRVD